MTDVIFKSLSFHLCIPVNCKLKVIAKLVTPYDVTDPYRANYNLNFDITAQDLHCQKGARNNPYPK
jgi:hypothetical protein